MNFENKTIKTHEVRNDNVCEFVKTIIYTFKHIKNFVGFVSTLRGTKKGVSICLVARGNVSIKKGFESHLMRGEKGSKFDYRRERIPRIIRK
jgi:hypothetical protein